VKHVWLASYPKSGNTWFRLLLANLHAGQKAPVHINDPPNDNFDIASSRVLFETATMLDSGLLSHDEVDALRPGIFETNFAESSRARWVKVHDAYTAILQGRPLSGRPEQCVAIYLVRDPRDVAVSLASHLELSLDHAIARLNSPAAALCDGHVGMAVQLRQKLLDWSGHVTSWLDQTDVPVHVLRYEDLLARTQENFAAALEFAGACRSKDDIARAVRHCDFRRLQRQECESGFVERWSHSAPFFRSGRVGGWRASLSASQAQAIDSCHAEVMERLGYV